jgi:hypothetical protein
MTKKADLETFKNVEFIDVTRRGRTLLTIKESELQGKNKRWLQEHVGNSLGEGHHWLSIKIAGQSTYEKQKIRAIATDPEKKNPVNDSASDEIAALRRSIEATQGNISIDLLKTAYQMQIDFYKDRVTALEMQLKDANEKIKKLEAETGDENNILDNPVIQALVVKLLGGNADVNQQ